MTIVPARYDRLILPLAVSLVLALSMGACGRKGPLEAHPDEPKAPGSAASEGKSSKRGFAIGNSRQQLSSPIKPPDRNFILDPLL